MSGRDRDGKCIKPLRGLGIESVSTTDVTVATIILPLRGREWFKENRSRSNHVILNLNFNRSTLHRILHYNLCELMCLMWFNNNNLR